MEKGLSLREVASKCGFSASFLSQVERGTSSPSIVSLLALCEILGIRAGDLLPAQSAERPKNRQDGTSGDPARSEMEEVAMACPILRMDECPKIHIPDSPVTYSWLSGPSQENQIEVVVGELPAGYEHPPHTHVGEEFGYILEGEVTAIIDSIPYLLNPGDSYSIHGARPHGFRTGESGVKILWYHTRRFMEWYASSREEVV